MLRFAHAVLILAALGAACSSETAPNQPAAAKVTQDDLARHAKEQKCSLIQDFEKDRPGVENPPYVVGALPGGVAAVFWCDHPELGGGNRYTLLIKTDGQRWPGGCADRIEGQDFAGGLSIVQQLDDPLDWYWNMRDQTPIAKAGQKTSGPGIQSVYDGTGAIYYCHDGRWVARPLH